MTSVFDRLTQGQAAEAKTSDEPAPAETLPAESLVPQSSASYTPAKLKAATQELLKFGLIEADRKPKLYQTLLQQPTDVNRVLEPFDLRMQIDDIRGLAILVVAESAIGETEGDEWSHPLVRRQRLTLEQSLMLAILRQQFLAHEQDAGIAASDAIVELGELLPQINLYLGESGSDDKDQKRLRNLLEHLKGHGIVSEISSDDQVTIRPIITHLANPENLQNLLSHFRGQKYVNRSGADDDPDTGPQEAPFE